MITHDLKRLGTLKAEGGQALTALLVYTATAIIITTSAVAVTIINAQAAGSYAAGEEALQAAEAGADNAVLRLVREPTYANETFSLGSGSVNITVTGAVTKTIIAEGVVGNYRRQIQVVGDLQNHRFTITSWQEI